MDSIVFEPQYQNVATARNLNFNEKIRELRSQGQTIYNFAFGQSPFPVPECAQNELKARAGENLYEAVLGIQSVREAIVKLHNKPHFDASRVLISPGCKEASWLLMHILKVPMYLVSPTWVTYESQCTAANKEFHWIETSFETGWKVTAKAFEAAIAKASVPKGGLLVLVNPDNPSGCTYTKAELEEVANVARKHDILILSDEIYALLAFDEKPGNTLVSMADVYPEGTIVGSGISKWSSCGGWRLGYHMYPAELAGILQRVKAAASWSYSCVAAPIQYGALPLMEAASEGKVPEFMRKASVIFCALSEYITNQLNLVGVKVLRSNSGFYLMPDFEVCRSEKIQNGTQLADKILEECGVAMVECGPSFGRDPKELTTRLCYIDFDGQEALDAVIPCKPQDAHLSNREFVATYGLASEEFLKKACGRSVSATQALVAWVKKNSS